MSTPDHKPKHLPRGLTATVGVVEEILGRVVADAEGADVFDAVEGVRREMVRFREADADAAREEALDRAAARLRTLSLERRITVARAYTLYLQLVNVCENAYRTHRLRGRRPDAAGAGRRAPEQVPGRAEDRAPGSAEDAAPGRAEDSAAGFAEDSAPGSGERTARRARLTFVLTAHPTESRSPANIRLLRRVQDHVIDSLERGRPIDRREVENLVHLAWRVGTHPAEKPSVEDEAGHLFSLLTDPILAEVIRLTEAGHRVLFRSWVGGDKDGHPGVGPAQTQAALARARTRLLAFVESALLQPVREDVDLAGRRDDDDRPRGRDDVGAPGWPVMAASLSGLERTLSALEDVAPGDGGRVEALREAMAAFQTDYRAIFGIGHPSVDRLAALLEVFPALVVPLELREERGRFGADAPIADMMRRLADIASGGRIGGYARAVVVSMTLEAEDLLEAQGRCREVFGESVIPVVPLFELPDVLVRAKDILSEAWRDEPFRHAVRERGRLEVMLGYSDTAKRMGMLASRVALHDAMREIGEWAESEGVLPLFFHGHGGSVGRGGGRIEDLAATWPPKARTPYKYTVQGEMVERTLATPEILRSLVGKVADVQTAPPPYQPVGRLARDLATASKRAFETRAASATFRRLLERATPYTRLESLTIGSRPSRRAGGGFEELRAIPWVLCWTQTRFLLHAWLGVGHAWRTSGDTSASHRGLGEALEDDPLFRSYARLLSFTMAKTEPAIWRRYLRVLGAGTTDEEMAALETELDEDYAAAIDLACRAVGADTLLPDRPWLEESIRYRAPMIHPLNLLQIELLARPEWTDAEVTLFRETVTGIAAGMLTTG